MLGSAFSASKSRVRTLPSHCSLFAHQSCFPHFTGEELKAEIGALHKPLVELAFQPDSGLVLLSPGFLAFSKHRRAQRSVLDLAFRSHCTSYPNSIQWHRLATFRHQPWGKNTRPPSAKPTIRAFLWSPAYQHTPGWGDEPRLPGGPSQYLNPG